MKVAIVCDWLIGGGAERVVEQLHKMFPEAPIYTSYATNEWREKLGGKVRTGYLQYWPFPALRKYVPFLRVWWFSQLNLKGYDLVISSSGAEAKFVKVGPKAKHIAYIHAPTHYYWDRYEDYLKQPGFGWFNWFARIGLMLLVGPMRNWDYKAAQRPDHLIANSNFTKAMIKKYYNRDSAVINPPVDIERFKPSAAVTRHGFLVAGRQTPYKRIDLAVKACTNLGAILTVIGDGPEHKNLRKMAGPTINFIKDIPDPEMPAHFQKAKAFIFPGTDDFGIIAVEAMAAGTPVIAFKGGGALDYVIEGKTGLFFNELSVDSLSKTLQSFEPEKFDSGKIGQSVKQFEPQILRKKMGDFIKSKAV